MSTLFNVYVDFLILLIIIFISRMWLIFKSIFHIFLMVLFPTFMSFIVLNTMYFVFSFSDYNFIIPSSWNSNNLVCFVYYFLLMVYCNFKFSYKLILSGAYFCVWGESHVA